MKAKYSVAISIRLTIIFLVLPSYLGDYFVPFLNNLTFNLDIWSLWLNSQGDDRAFPYGIAMLIAYVPSLVLSQFLQLFTLDSIRALEIAVGLQMLAVESLLWRHLETSKSMKKSLNIFLFSPLIIWVNYFLGLNDFFPSVCLFFGSYLLLSHKYRSAGVLIGIAIGMKFSLALVLPFLILFAWDNPRFKKSIWITTAVTTFVGAAMYAPAIYSSGFRIMVLNNKESTKALDFYLNLGSNKILVLPVIYLLLLYWLWKAGRISLEVLIAFFGIALFLISAFSPASIGWMLWGLPLMFMNLAKQQKSRINLVIIQILFLMISVFSGSQIETVFGNLYLPTLVSDSRDTVFTLAIVLVTIWSYSNLKAAIHIGDRYKIAKAPLTVSIAGDSGTGKDTLANALKDFFTPDMATVICGDDYHKYERGDASWKNTTHLNPAGNYLDLWERDYNLACTRKYFEQREYDHDSGKFTQLKPRMSRDLVVSQGLHGLFSRLTSKSDLKIFLSMDRDLRIKLKLERDRISRNQTYESVLESIKSREEDYELYIAPQIDNTDLHFHLFESKNKLSLRIATNRNYVIGAFVKTLEKFASKPVSEIIELNQTIYEIDSDHFDKNSLKNVLNIHLSGYNQLFLKEPRIPEGILGFMTVLTVVVLASSREEYNA
jgi:uridine kinase